MGAPKRRLSDVVAAKSGLTADLRAMDILDKEVEVLSYEVIQARRGEAAKLHVILDGEEKTVLTWSGVVLDNLRLCEDEFPLVGTLVKKGNYYKFV